MMACTLALLQEIYSEREPYVDQIRLGGNVVIFDDVFIRLCIEAFLDGCLLKMSEDELALFQDFIAYEEGTLATPSNAVIKLDLWLSNMANNIENPTLGECTN